MECYVCMSGGDDMLENICLCKDARVHTHCLGEWIRRTGQVQCSVYKAHYRGVSWNTEEDGEITFTKNALRCVLLLSAVGMLFLNMKLASIALFGHLGAVGVVFYVTVCTFECLWIHGLVRGLSDLPPASRRYLKLYHLYEFALRV